MNLSSMYSKRYIIILLAISIFLTIIFFKEDLAKFFITDYEENGRYFSRHFDSIISYANTLDYKKIGITEQIVDDGVVYNFQKRKNEKIIIRVLKGMPYNQIPLEYRNLSAISVVNNGSLIINKKDNELETGINYIKLKDGLVSENKKLSIKLTKTRDDISQQTTKQFIRRLEISFLPQGGRFITNLPLIILFIFFPIVLHILMCNLFINEKKTFILSLFFLFIFFIFHSFFEKIEFLHLLVFLNFSILGFFIFTCKFKKISSYFLPWLFLLIVLLSIFLRWEELKFNAFAPLHLDAGGPIGYKAQADNLKFPFRGIFVSGEGVDQHERMYPFIIKLFFYVFGSSELHTRFVTVFFSMLIVVGTYFIAKRILNNRFLALLAMFISSVNGVYIENSIYGLRTELECFLLLSILYIGFLKEDFILSKPWIWSIILGLCSSLLVLTRGFYFFPVLFFASFFILKKRKFIHNKILPVLLIIFLIVAIPYTYWRLQIYNKHHSWTWDKQVYTGQIAASEFNDPSFLSKRITLYDYFFKMHSFSEIIKYTLAGIGGTVILLNGYVFNASFLQNNFFKSIFFYKKSLIANINMIFLFIAGTLIVSFLSFFYILISKKKRILFLMIFIPIYYCLFFIGFYVINGRAPIEINRALIPVLPFFIIAILSFIQHVSKFIARGLKFVY